MVGSALALVVGTACSSKTKSSSPSTTPGESTTTAAGGSQSGGGKAISIKSFAYQPATIQAKVGDTITVTNNDNTPHTVTSDDFGLVEHIRPNNEEVPLGVHRRAGSR